MDNLKNNLELNDSSEHIAIIGMSGRFPGAKNIDEFWQNLRDGVESIKFFTKKELAASNMDQVLLNNPKYVGADGIIDDMDMFDASFFNITPREAEIMDPQHRFFLECAWEALENAGYDPEIYKGLIGVWASAGLSNYLIRNIMANPDFCESASSFQTMLGNDKDFVATRVSYKLNLKGPSINVATLCSSSFVAIHLASQSLLNYHCDMAMAGAVSLQVSRNEAFFYQEGGIGDPDGHCRAFDADAQGTVSGSGLGIVILKRLDDALNDGDHIHAVIRGSAVNNDGSMKISYTAPSVEGQAKVIAEAISLAGVNPETITYIETHGTGTNLGDPIEIEALTKAFRTNTQKKGFCAVGSVKTNIGHLVNAGGVASLIKTVLALKHKQIPASLNFERPNPKIDFLNSPFYVNSKLSEWNTDEIPRRAGVSSFGIGGTNVHLIVEEAPTIEPSGKSGDHQLLVLSARSNSALDTLTVNLAEHLRQHPDINLADVAYTLQVGRRVFNHRRVLLCRDLKDATKVLSTIDPKRVLTQFQESKNRPVVFMFPELRKQYVNMGLELYQSEPTFRKQVDPCSEILEPYLKFDLRHIMYPSKEKTEEALQQFGQVAITQLALFVIEYALAKLWMQWGINPQAMIGHSIGEYVAACLAGVFSLEDALALAVTHSQIENNNLGTELFVKQVKNINLNSPKIPCVSHNTGTWITEKEVADPAYWAENLQQTTHITETIQQLLKEPEQILLEVSPGRSLSTLMPEHPDKTTHQLILSSVCQRENSQLDVKSLLTTLGKLWLAGANVDWSGFHNHERRHRLPLPTYPFEHHRYWVEPFKQTKSTETGAKPSLTRNPDIADWFYIPVWKTSFLPKFDGWTNEKGNWLLFVDEHDVGSAMAKYLRQAGQKITTVTTGEQFNRLKDGTYTLNLRQRADYTTLFKELKALDRLPHRIVHLWSVTSDCHNQSEIVYFKQSQDKGFYSLLFLAQALGEYTSTDSVQLWVVSNDVQKIESSDVSCPEKATILGSCRVIPQEYLHVTCRYIDIVLPVSNTQSKNNLARQLLSEIGANSSCPVVAYRDHQRWLQTFEPLQLPAEAKPNSVLRKNGVYLMTNALVDVGFAMAEYLARTIQAKLVLVENTPFSKKEQWTKWLESNTQREGASGKIQNIQILEGLGAEVFVVKANLTNVTQMQNVLAHTIARFGNIHGVIHSVGNMVPSTFRTIQDADYTKTTQLFESEMRGLLVLKRILSDRDLDFCLLNSSLASIIGGLGQITYAATNSFMDVFASNCRMPWLSINWEAWRIESEQQRFTALTPRLAQFAISSKEGNEVFLRILSAYAGNRIVVSTRDLLERIKHLSNVAYLQDQKQVNTTLPKHAKPKLTTSYVAPRNELERTITDIWQEKLGIEKIGIDDNFFELGGDSLIATQIISRICDKFQVELPLRNLLETPTIVAFAESIKIKQILSTIEADPQITEIETHNKREEIQF
jgi:acyl transferase domain-containing protein/acyl carrier protein